MPQISTSARVLVSLLLVTTLQTAAQGQFWPLSTMGGIVETAQGLARAAFVSVYSFRLLDVKSELLAQFFSGLDEVKQCAVGMSMYTTPITVTPPPKTLRQHLLSWTIPGYARYLRYRTEKAQQELYAPPVRSWPLCVVGTVRSSAAAYFVMSSALTNIIPSVVTNMLPFSFFSDDSYKKIAGSKLKKRLIDKASQYHKRLLLN